MLGLNQTSANSSYNYSFAYGNKDNEADLYNHRGITYIRNGEYDRAIASFSKAMELDPNYVEVYNNRGHCLLLQR